MRQAIILRETWFDSPCSKGAYLHLIGDFDAGGQCIVDNSQNMMILHPDYLVSATVVSDSISCQRRAALQERIKFIGEIEKAQLFGIVFHEIFQEAMKMNKWDIDSLRQVVEAVLLRHIENFYSIHMNIPDAIEYAMERIPDLRAWANTFLRVKPGVSFFFFFFFFF